MSIDNNPHLSRFFNSNCLCDLSFYYINYSDSKKRNKEITESIGCYAAAESFLGNLDDYDVYVVGDGVMPRTGSAFSFFSKAGVFSIDPLMRTELIDQYHEFKRKACGRPIRR